MSKIKSVKTSKKDAFIDDIVTDQATRDDAWEKEMTVVPKLMPTSLRLSTRTIERAKFFARLHHERGYQTWLKKIIEDRVNTEYEMFRTLKKENIVQ
jgi:hypothetical protein